VTTDDLVLALAKELTPVRRLPRVGPRTLRYCGGALAVVVVILALYGLRADWRQKLADAEFLREQAALLAFFALSAWSAFVLCVPGRDSWLVRALPVAGLGVWLALVLSRDAGLRELGPAGIKCVARMSIMALVPLAALGVALRRSPPLETARALGLGVWSVAALGVFGMQWLCTRDSALHVLVWHAGPLLLAGLAGRCFGAMRSIAGRSS